MSEWAAKRFWTDAKVVDADDGFTVELDGRKVKTPGKRGLVMPTRIMAEQVAAEWDAQEEVIDPRTMPWTRSVNSALDKVAPQKAEVRAHLAEYATTDMVSYRADHPDELIARQATHWDPLIAKVSTKYNATLKVTSGVMPIQQSDEDKARLAGAMRPMSDFALTGFHDLVTLPGSFVIALAVINEWDSPESLWSVARLDELWQIEQWGPDAEAEELAESKRQSFLHAAAFYRAAS